MNDSNRSHQPDNGTEDRGVLVVLTERILSRDGRIELDMDTEDAVRTQGRAKRHRK
jgi:hypothetical protein